MKKMSKLGFVLVLLAAISLVVCGCSKETATWGTSFDEACVKAEETNSNVLIFFSNIESDPISQELNTLFATPKFQSKIGKNYQLVNIDFPKTEGTMEYSQMVANYELATKFSVQALPTIILATPDGYVIGSVFGDTLIEKPAKAIKMISSFNSASKKVSKARVLLAKAEGMDRVPLIDSMVDKLDRSYRYLLLDLLKEIPTLDPENTSGLLTKYKMNYAYAEALEEYSKGNAQKAIDIFVETAQVEGIPAQDAQEAYQTAAYLASVTGLGSNEIIVAYLEKAIAVYPKSESAKAIQETIDYLKGASAEEAVAPTAEEATDATSEAAE